MTGADLITGAPVGISLFQRGRTFPEPPLANLDAVSKACVPITLWTESTTLSVVPTVRVTPPK